MYPPLSTYFTLTSNVQVDHMKWLHRKVPVYSPDTNTSSLQIVNTGFDVLKRIN